MTCCCPGAEWRRYCTTFSLVMTVWHHQLLLILTFPVALTRDMHSNDCTVMCKHHKQLKERMHTHIDLRCLRSRSCCIYRGTCRTWRHVWVRWMHPCMHAYGCEYRLLLAVGCLHNQHSSTPWSQGKLSTVSEKKTLFHTWVVREWPTFRERR